MPLYRALPAAPAPPAPKPATPPLPAELTDYILDCLEGDRRALFSCALVCRAWLPRARHHAFRTLHLTPDNVDGFLALLAAPSGTLNRGRTRALHVRQNQTHGREPLLDKLLASPLIPDALAHVEQLTVLYANWTPRAAEARFGAFARVTVLKLCLPGYPSVDDFVDFVCAHPALRELELGWNDKRIRVRILVILDDAHTLHPQQFEALFRAMTRREMQIGRWMMMRFDALSPSSVFQSPDDDALPGLKRDRDYLDIFMQSPARTVRRQSLLLVVVVVVVVK